MSPSLVPGDAASTALEDLTVLVDQEVVADITPPVGDDVHRLIAADDPRGLCLRVRVGAGGVVDDHTAHRTAGGIAALARPGTPAIAGDDRRLGDGGEAREPTLVSALRCRDVLGPGVDGSDLEVGKRPLVGGHTRAHAIGRLRGPQRIAGRGGAFAVRETEFLPLRPLPRDTDAHPNRDSGGLDLRIPAHGRHVERAEIHLLEDRVVSRRQGSERVFGDLDVLHGHQLREGSVIDPFGLERFEDRCARRGRLFDGRGGSFLDLRLGSFRGRLLVDGFGRLLRGRGLTGHRRRRRGCGLGHSGLEGDEHQQHADDEGGSGTKRQQPRMHGEVHSWGVCDESESCCQRGL